MGFFDWLLGSGQPQTTHRQYVTMETETGERVRIPAGAARAIVRLQQRGRRPSYRGRPASGWRMVKRNPTLSTAEREALPDSAFAAPEIRGLPVHDAGHVRSAIGRFSRQVFRNRAEAQTAARRIVEAAQRLGVSVGEGSTVAQMAGAYVEKMLDRRRNLDAFTDASGVIHPIRGTEGYDSYYDSADHRQYLAGVASRQALAEESDWRQSWEEDEGDWADEVRRAVRGVSKYGIAPHAGKREGEEYRYDVPLYLKNKRGLPADEVAQLISYQYPHLGIESEDDLLQALAEGTWERRNNPKRKPKKYLTANEIYALKAIYGDTWAKMNDRALTSALTTIRAGMNKLASNPAKKSKASHVPSLPGMGPSFGGIQYKPIDTGKGGWGSFMLPAKSPGLAEQRSLFDCRPTGKADNPTSGKRR